MTPEQQRVAIAEACGWKTGYRDPEAWHPLPDYLNNLNAMHNAEKDVFQSSDLWQKFVFELILTSGGNGMSELDRLCCLVQSTAAQRAEAFLRTIGKWEAK